MRNPPRPREAAQAPTLQATAPAALTASSTVTSLSSGSGSPHAVSQTGTGTSATFYYYDGRGNQTVRDAPGTANDRTITYSADDKAHEISMGGGQRVRFWYGPDGQRYKRDEAGKTTYYVGGVEVILQGGVTTFKRYLGGIALQTVVSGGIQATKYLFHDHLGSLVRIANADGSVAESLDYTAFGDRRSYSDPNASGTASSNTPRGFTGHEYVDGTGVIHMNGRIYDQELGRFLQADPVIQAPDNAQSWNAYTYVFNNPLAYTDPTGMMSDRAWSNLWSLAGIAVSIISAGAASPYFAAGTMAGTATGFAIVAAGGFVAGYASAGTLKGAVTGAFTAVLTAGIANSGWNVYQQVAAQAMTGGIMESLRGGNFGNGFMAAGLTAAFMPHAGKGNTFVRAMKGALIGGTISAATGGKFANGAISGAIQGAMAGKPDIEESKQLQAATNNGDDWGIDSRTAYRGNIKSTFDPFSNSWSVSGSISVGGVMNTQVAAQLNDAYNFLMTNGSETISVAIAFTPVAAGADLMVSWFSPADISALQAGGNWPAAGRMRFGSTSMQLSQQFWQANDGVIPHEFGHGLGLHHAPPGTRSYMAPSMIRGWQWQDAVNIRDQFVCNPASITC